MRRKDDAMVLALACSLLSASGVVEAASIERRTQTNPSSRAGGRSMRPVGQGPHIRSRSAVIGSQRGAVLPRPSQGRAGTTRSRLSSVGRAGPVRLKPLHSRHVNAASETVERVGRRGKKGRSDQVPRVPPERTRKGVDGGRVGAVSGAAVGAYARGGAGVGASHVGYVKGGVQGAVVGFALGELFD